LKVVISGDEALVSSIHEFTWLTSWSRETRLHSVVKILVADEALVYMSFGFDTADEALASMTIW
jgi:hypothetical protein